MNIKTSACNKYEILIDSGSSECVDIIFAGDFCPGKRTEALCANQKYDKIFNDAFPILQEKDFSIVNLECPITNSENPIVKVGPHLRAKSESLHALRFADFDIVTLANNHIRDHGDIGVNDTLENCKSAGIMTVGAGTNQKEAEKPLIISKKGISIGIINFTENEFSISKNNRAGAYGLDPISIYYQVADLKKKVDAIVMIIHGGNEHYQLPSPETAKLYHFFADLGITAIIGHHSHCPSGFEVYNGVPIFYSIGNFLFDVDEKQNNLWYLGYLVKLSINKKSVSKISIFPFEQFKSTDGISLLNGDKYEKFIDDIKELSKIINNDELLKDRWDNFCKRNEKYYLSSIFNLSRLKRAFVRRGIGINYFIPRNNLLELLGKVKCEAHREAIIKILESIIERKISC